MMDINKSEENISLIFLIIPTILIISGIIIFTYPIPTNLTPLLTISLFSGLILLGLGSFYNRNTWSNKIKILGWMIFAFYWSSQINSLYFAEQGDFVNASICIIGVYIFFYFAYHEWLCIKRNEKIESINWIAGATSLAGLIYSIIELTPLANWLIEVVAFHSGWILNIFTGNVIINGRYLTFNQAYIRIIFACTAVQSMVLFIGMILPLSKVENTRKIIGLCITIIPIYFLNLIRNAGITYLVGIYGNDFFNIAHNIIGKIGSLIALIILLLIVVKVIPEIFDEIIDLSEIYKRNGPLEKSIKKIWRKN